MNVTEFIDEDLIFTDESFETCTDVFSFISEKALKKKLVTSKFKIGLIDREERFPTGLSLETYGVALPHTDPEHVNKQFISLITLEKPVIFKSMANSEEEIEVSVIFILGLNEPHSQLTALQQLMEIIQDKDVIEKIINSSTSKEISKLLEDKTLSLKGGE